MSSTSRFALLFALGVGYTGLTMTSNAKTPDGKTPAEETVCDDVSRSLFGLCNAYCEAMDCDSDDPSASDEACDSTLDSYLRKSGGDAPPCDDDDDGGDTGDTGECEPDTPPDDGTCYTDSCTGQVCCPDFNDPSVYNCF